MLYPHKNPFQLHQNTPHLFEDHIHFHVVPRWNGDTNFMPVIGETKVQVQGLQETYNELKIDFDKIINNR